MALNKSQKQALIEKMLGERMPTLEAAIDSEQKLAAAATAVEAAQANLNTAREAHGVTYTAALDAGWTAGDLDAAGVTKATPTRARKPSSEEAAAASR